jgi:hypothetical protein
MSTTTTAIPVVELGMDELEKIIERSKDGLPDEDRETLRTLLHSYAFLLDELRDRKTSIERLRRMVFGAATETRENVRKEAGKPAPTGTREAPGTKGEKRKGHGRLPAEVFVGAETVEVRHEQFRPGDPCPCGQSRLYHQKKPARLLRIRGRAPLVATVYELERLRCGLCGKVYTAKAPEGVGEEKFDETAPSMIAFLRYGSGFPMNRLAGLQKLVGMPLPVSTQWDLVARAALKLQPVHAEMVRRAGEGTLLYNDDTPMTILAHLSEKRRREERGEPPPERTGTFTSGIVSEFADGRRIVLYFTGRRHAGENLYEVLKTRPPGLEPPMQMCDGLDRNLPGDLKTILSNCWSHGRRQFVDVAAGFPDEVMHLVDELAIVFENDARAKAGKMTPEERLRHHQEHSGPVMERLKEWMDGLIADKKVEPNSGLGKAIAYATKRWLPLTLFLRLPGAVLDNNLTERMLKKAILHRKGSMFYKTENGARVGDLYMSLIATAKLARADPFHYLTEVQRHAGEAAACPGEWLPWNYREALARAPPTPGA